MEVKKEFFSKRVIFKAIIHYYGDYHRNLCYDFYVQVTERVPTMKGDKL